MIEMTVEDYFERLEIRDSKCLGEKERITQLVPQQRKIKDNYEQIVNQLKDNEYFSMNAIAKQNHVSEVKLKQYILEWCKEHDRDFSVFRGGKKGSIITVKTV